MVVARWLDDGIAPCGASGRVFGPRGVHGYDLTFCAPKSVSLMRALGDEVTQSDRRRARHDRRSDGVSRLNHAGYTRVHNPVTGEKDLVRLPGLWR